MGVELFSATCPACGREARFVELRIEACLQPDEGPAKAWRGFKCLACKKRTKEVTGPDGLHRFVDGEHVVAEA